MRFRMLKYVFFLLLLLGCRNIKPSQNIDDTRLMLSKADSLFNNGNLTEAIKAYQKSLNKNKHNKKALYSLASSYSLLSKKDSAYKYLSLATKNDSTFHYIVDPYYLNLINDTKWNEILNNLILKNSHLNLKNNNKLIKKLIILYIKDQSFYYEIENFNNKQYYTKKRDSIVIQNSKDLENIIEQYGWPKKSEVGEVCARSAFLVLQHSSIDIQKKYLPEITNLLKQEEISYEMYPLLIDRINIRDGKKQIFGTQLSYDDSLELPFFDLSSVENIDSLNIRRKKYNLSSIEDYLMNWNIIWDSNKLSNYPESN